MEKPEEKKFKIVVHLINGEQLACSLPVGLAEIQSTYQALGATDSRVKLPTASDTMQFLPASSVLRIEAVGPWEQ